MKWSRLFKALKGVARTALHFQKLVPAKIQETQLKTIAMVMGRGNKGLNLRNGNKTRMEGIKWKQKTPWEHSNILHLPELFYLIKAEVSVNRSFSKRKSKFC